MQPKENNNQKPNRPPNKGAGAGGKNAAGPSRRGRQSGGKKTQTQPMTNSLSTSRGQAVRAQRRSQQDAQRIANQYLTAENKPAAPRANVIDDNPRLKVIGLGGMDGGGSKNMILVEYM